VISGEPVNPVAEAEARPQRSGLWIPLVLVWLLMLLTFSVPGREGPDSASSLDAIALAKVAVRLLGFSVLGLTIVRSWRHPRRGEVVRCLWPLGLFIGWSLLSVLWSALPSFSLGQVGGLLVQVMLAFVVGLRCTDSRDRSTVMQHLFLAMLAFSLVILAVHSLAPDSSGLERVSFDDWEGIVHPTAAGATASLALVILIAARLLWDWRWTRLWLAPGLLVQGALLVLARSRTALVMGIAGVVLSFFLFSRQFVLSLAAVLLGLVLGAYLVLDPGLNLADRLSGSVSGYARRGESDEQIQSFNGRMQLWGVIWDEFLRSPVIGHGYLVTSRTGAIDVWQPEHPSNKTAHNVLLQVFASTGLVGGLLFLWGLIQPLAVCRRALLADPENRKLAAFLGIIGIWYFGWGLFSESFMGAVAPESVVFFTLLGLAVGSLPVDGPGR
jgi:O-antigen ligase